MSETYELDERAQILLKQLIKQYTHDAQPVGSKNLAQLSGLDVSSATIRNIMHKLENLGLVDSPHTSAGRIPTAAGYRFFIDSLLEVNDLGRKARKTISDTLSASQTTSGLIRTASDLLSNITQLTGVVSLSHNPVTEVRHIEFMSIGEKRILVILVINKDEVHNKVINTDRQYSDSELRQASQTLNQYLVGENFQIAREKLVQELGDLKSDVNSIMEKVIGAMDEVCNEISNDELLTSGESNLFDYAELSDINKLRDLFDAFNKKKDLLKLLDNCTSAKGVEIFIGSESGYSVLSDCSVVGAPYQINGEVVGVLGVVGPTRIAYERIIPVVDVTAKLLSSALNSQK